MKLTIDQVAAEREKFDNWWIENIQDYDPIFHDFKVWLACRESIEIELPKAATKLNHFDDPMKIYYADDLIPHLEAQGFKVKS